MKLLGGVTFEYAGSGRQRCPLCDESMSWVNGAEIYRKTGKNPRELECDECGLLADAVTGACYLRGKEPLSKDEKAELRGERDQSGWDSNDLRCGEPRR